MDNYTLNQINSKEYTHFVNDKHSSLLYIDSDERVNGSYADAFFKSEEIVGPSVYKLGVSKIHVKYNLPTIIAGRNDTITFFSPTSGLNHSVILDPGYYTPVLLAGEIETQLNTVSGASGVTFSATKVINSTNTYTITALTTFQFISSTHVDKGRSSSGITVMSTPSLGITVCIKCFYTSYLDWIIQPLKESAVRSSTFSAFTNFSNSGHIFRQHVNQFPGVYSDIAVDYTIDNINYNKVRRRILTDLNIQLFDEYGDLIFNDGSNYLSYAMEISLLS